MLIEIKDLSGRLCKAVADMSWFQYLRHLAERKELRNHFVVPGASDFKDQAPIFLFVHPLAWMERFFLGPLCSFMMNANAIATRCVLRAKECDAVSEQ